MSFLTDKNIESVEEIFTPRDFMREIPITSRQESVVGNFRQTIQGILDGRDLRLLAVVGPCSIHDIKGATEFAQRLSALAHELQESLYIIMRVYFEKPRNDSGWSGLITDPFMSGDFHRSLFHPSDEFKTVAVGSPINAWRNYNFGFGFGFDAG